MSLSGKYPLIQADDIWLSEGEVQVLEDLGKVKAARAKILAKTKNDEAHDM